MKPAVQVCALLMVPLPVGCSSEVSSEAGVQSTAITSDAAAPSEDIVQIADGKLRGRADSDVVHFDGIPYAAPPVEALRFRPPAPVAPWSGVRDATSHARACMQSSSSELPEDQISEDCLYLNVTVPRTPSREPLPVMVWLHGGGFTDGAAWNYHPTRLVAEGKVIVVTVDFRLGIFGFFGFPSLAGSGTFGLMDQQAALRWVRQNVAAFGGDSANVTLFGESGGAVGTCTELVSPRAAGLFDKAILQSGNCLLTWPANGLSLFPPIPAGSFWRSRAEVEQSGVAAAAALGCGEGSGSDALGCLQRVGVDGLLEHDNDFPNVAFDTQVLPLEPATALARGLVNRVPIVSGHNHDEARILPAIRELVGLPPLTETDYTALLTQAFGERADEVKAEYPTTAYDSVTLAWSAMDTDRVFACTQLATSRALAKRMPVFAYEFNDENAPPFTSVPFPADIPNGASHGSELAYLFDIDFHPPEPLDAGQAQLAARMRESWAAFARRGRPVSRGTPSWRAWEPGARAPYVESLVPGRDDPHPVNDAREHHCEFWRRFEESVPRGVTTPS